MSNDYSQLGSACYCDKSMQRKAYCQVESIGKKYLARDFVAHSDVRFYRTGPFLAKK